MPAQGRCLALDAGEQAGGAIVLKTAGHDPKRARLPGHQTARDATWPKAQVGDGELDAFAGFLGNVWPIVDDA